MSGKCVALIEVWVTKTKLLFGLKIFYFSNIHDTRYTLGGNFRDFYLGTSIKLTVVSVLCILKLCWSDNRNSCPERFFQL